MFSVPGVCCTSPASRHSPPNPRLVAAADTRALPYPVDVQRVDSLVVPHRGHLIESTRHALLVF